MRLIDADAEIARIRQEVERIEAKINRLKKLMEEEPLNTIHDFAEELEQCYRNKADCQAEISTLTNYVTAYDVDKVVEQLEVMKNSADAKAAEYDEAGRLDLMDMYDAEATAYRNARRIVQSALND